MINYTNKIIIKDLTGINQEFNSVMDTVNDTLSAYYTGKKRDNLLFKTKIQKSALKRKITKQNLEDLCEYSIVKDFNCDVVKEVSNSEILLLEKPYIKNGFKLFFLELWKRDLVILPLSLNLGNSFKEQIENQYDNDFIYEIKKHLIKHDKKNDELARMAKLLRATDYKQINDADFNEISEFHIVLMKNRNGQMDSGLPKTKFQIENLLAFIKYNNPKFPYEAFEYKKWYVGYFNRYKEFSYLDYQNNKEHLEEYRRNYNNQQTKDRNKKKKESLGIEPEALTIEKEFFNIVKNSHSWKNGIPLYEGYSFKNIKKASTWQIMLTKYLEYRKKQGYESTKSIIVNINYLFNYLFFYLNL